MNGSPAHQEHRALGPARADRDAALVERLRRRDAAAVEALVAAYSARLYRLAIYITGNAMEAEEVVQDALWTASRKIDTFREDSAFRRWLYRITTNAAYQALRRRRRALHEVSGDDLGRSLEEPDRHREPVADWSALVDEPALQTELRAVLTAAIHDLPVGYRLALVLHDVEGLSNLETAAVLRLSLPAVKSRVHRSRLFVRERLAESLRAPGPAPATLRALGAS